MTNRAAFRSAAIGLVSAALGLGFGAFPARAAAPQVNGIEGCVAGYPTADGPDGAVSASCSYTATHRGGYAGSGSWSVTVSGARGTFVYSSEQGSPPCSYGVIQAGDAVRITALEPGGAIVAGNPESAGVDTGLGLRCSAATS